MSDVYAVQKEKLDAIVDAINLKRDRVGGMEIDDMPLEIGLIGGGVQNLAEGVGYEDFKYIATDGKLYNNTDTAMLNKTSNPIDISGLSHIAIMIKVNNGDVFNRGFFYDENMTPIVINSTLYAYSTYDETDGLYTRRGGISRVPLNAKYFRMSMRTYGYVELVVCPLPLGM